MSYLATFVFFIQKAGMNQQPRVLGDCFEICLECFGYFFNGNSVTSSNEN